MKRGSVSYAETNVVNETWVQTFDAEGHLTSHLNVYPGGSVKIFEVKEVPDEAPNED